MAATKKAGKVNGLVCSLVSQKARDALVIAWERRRAITLVCPHCGYTCNGRGIGCFTRYHGERCKHKLPEPIGPEMGDLS